VLRRLILVTATLTVGGLAPTAWGQEAPPTTAPPTTVATAPTTTVLAAEGGVPPPPTLIVEPDTGLADGQTVTISGSGWANPIGPEFCGDEIGDTSQTCIVVGDVEAGLDGELHGFAVLPARFTRPDGRQVDCFVEQCRVLVTDFRASGAVALVTFSDVIVASPGFTG
jgi:hypothetical protein